MAYKDPPKEHQFKPGQSGNPKGRPEGTLNIRTVIKKWIEVTEDYDNPLTGVKENLTQYDIIVLEQLAKAKKGNNHSFAELVDRLDGRAVQQIDANIQENVVAKLNIVPASKRNA